MNYDFDPVTLAEESVNNNYDSRVWSKNYDKDVYFAKNWFDWLTDTKYLNIIPFGKQVEFGAKLFEDYCPGCSDLDFLNNLFNESVDEIKEKIVWLNNGVCPKCHKPRTAWFNVVDPYNINDKPFFNKRNELSLCLGQRSTKTATTGMIATYILHKYLEMPNPAKYFNLLPTQTLQMTFTALTAGQAEETLWDEFSNIVDFSPWYQEYFKWCDDIGKKEGTVLYKYPDTFLSFNHKKLISLFSSSNRKILRGKTRIFFAIDELGWFDSEANSQRLTQNADETYTSLVNSLSTIRTAADNKVRKGDHNVLTAYAVNISSPAHFNDKIIRLVKTAKTDNKSISYHLPTWEVNPKLSREGLKTSINDPTNFDRDFGAEPPLANNPLLNNETLTGSLWGKHDNNEIIKAVRKETAKNETSKYLHLDVVIPKMDKNIPRILTVDTGYAHNAFAISLWHYDLQESKLVCDWCDELIPQVNSGISYYVNLHKTFESCILRIIEKLNIITVIYDRWQSLKELQQLEDKGVDAINVSLKYKDFVEIIKPYLEKENVLLPKAEMSFNKFKQDGRLLEQVIKDKPVLHMGIQAFTVRDLGRKITKPQNDDDDLFRTMALAIHYLNTDENSRKLGSFTKTKIRKNHAVGVVKSYGNAKTNRKFNQVFKNDNFLGIIK